MRNASDMLPFIAAATMLLGWSGRKKPAYGPAVKKFEPVPIPGWLGQKSPVFLQLGDTDPSGLH